MSWEDLEALYWRFDAMHKGYGEWSGRPTSERDAFKRTVKQALDEKDQQIERWKNLSRDEHVRLLAESKEHLLQQYVNLTQMYGEQKHEIRRLTSAIAEKDQEIEHLKDQYAWKISPAMVEAKIDELHQAYHALMAQAMRLSEYAALISDAVLRVGEFENETDSWPVYHHAGGINNECSGVIAEFPTERLSRAFVDYHTVANEFLASPEVKAWREQEEGKR